MKALTKICDDIWVDQSMIVVVERLPNESDGDYKSLILLQGERRIYSKWYPEEIVDYLRGVAPVNNSTSYV